LGPTRNRERGLRLPAIERHGGRGSQHDGFESRQIAGMIPATIPGPRIPRPMAIGKVVRDAAMDAQLLPDTAPYRNVRRSGAP
jgi:hypothetical protein